MYLRKHFTPLLRSTSAYSTETFALENFSTKKFIKKTIILYIFLNSQSQSKKTNAHIGSNRTVEFRFENLKKKKIYSPLIVA